MTVPVFKVDLGSGGCGRLQLPQARHAQVPEKVVETSPVPSNVFELADNSIGREIGTLLKKMKSDEHRPHSPAANDAQRDMQCFSRGPSVSNESNGLREPSKLSLSEAEPSKQTSRWSAKIDLRIPFENNGVEIPCTSMHLKGSLQKASSQQATPRRRSCPGGRSLPHASSSSSLRRKSNAVQAQRSKEWLTKQDAWLNHREEKRSSSQKNIGRFSPRLPVTEGGRKPEKSPQWWAGPQGGGSLHERAMRAIARRESRQQRHHEERLVEELKECTFAPDISASQRRSVQEIAALSSCNREASSVDAVDPVSDAVSSTTGNDRIAKPIASVACRVTSERAAEFYEEQVAWRESCLEQRERCLEAQAAQKLLEEERARTPETRQQPASPTFGKPAPALGILSRTVYDRQMCWRQQRDHDLEELRQAYYSAMTSPRSRSASPATTKRFSSNPPRSISRRSSCANASRSLIEQLQSARGRQSPVPLQSPRPRSQSPTSVRQFAQLRGHSSTPTRTRSSSAPTTPRTPAFAVTHLGSHVPGLALVQRLQASRMQTQVSSTVASHPVRSSSAPSTPRYHRSSTPRCTRPESNATTFMCGSPLKHPTSQAVVGNATTTAFTLGSPTIHSVPHDLVGRSVTKPSPCLSPQSQSDAVVHARDSFRPRDNVMTAHPETLAHASSPYRKVVDGDLVPQPRIPRHRTEQPTDFASWHDRAEVDEMLHVLTCCN